ncbi:hypothetical protein CKF58_05205 [Psittacicella hinzii]|uniref:EamA domain-containing protein n=2 Tax=Psittacicella hinzii TaxID=2028575 RepID=A0A3A1YHR8_9GAMM|nr:hypothetical protein CKF58_05205 [Psittacicella hinzii]
MTITLSIIYTIRKHAKAKAHQNKLSMELATKANIGVTSATSMPPASMSTQATIIPAQKFVKPTPDSPMRMAATARQIPKYYGSWHNTKWLFIRSITGAIAMLTYIYTCNALSLADADMMTKLTSVFLIIICSIFLKERTSITQFGVVVVSLFGAMLIIKPSFNNPHIGAYFIGLIGTLSSAITYIAVRRLTTQKNGEHPLTVECHLATLIVLICLWPALYYFQGFAGQLKYYIYLIIASLLSVAGQYTFTFALKYAPAVEISVYSYSSLLWNCIYGFIFFATIPDSLSQIGYFLIVVSGITLFFYNKRRLKILSNIRRMLHENSQKRRLDKLKAQAAAQAENGNNNIAMAATLSIEEFDRQDPIVYAKQQANNASYRKEKSLSHAHRFCKNSPDLSKLTAEQKQQIEDIGTGKIHVQPKQTIAQAYAKAYVSANNTVFSSEELIFSPVTQDNANTNQQGTYSTTNTTTLTTKAAEEAEVTLIATDIDVDAEKTATSSDSEVAEPTTKP